MSKTGQRLAERPGFDAEEWAFVCRAVVALLAGDPDAFGREYFAMYKTFDNTARTAAYLRFALRYRCLVQLRKAPNQLDLEHLAARAAPRYDRYVKEGAASLLEVLETVWGLREPSPRTVGSRFKVYGGMALAALIDDPKDLDPIEPALREWIDDYADEFADYLKRSEATAESDN